jgi:hypothetical protein
MGILDKPNSGDDNPLKGGPPSGRGTAGGGSGVRGTLLGVPKGYETERAGQPHPGMSIPQYAHGYNYRTHSWGTQPADSTRYVEGDEVKPANKPTDDIIEMQRKLVMAGYLSSTAGFGLGKWDNRTMAAYKNLLEDANRQGLDADSTLRRAIENGGMQIGGKTGRFTIDPETGEIVPISFVPPNLPPLQAPNRADLIRVFTAATADKLGQALPPDQIAQMADAYRMISLQPQVEQNNYAIAQARAEFEGTNPPQAPVIESAPTAEGFAQDEAKRRDPGGYEATQAYGYAQEFFDALGGYT